MTKARRLAPLNPLFHKTVSRKDGRSVFEVLLQTNIYLHSSYEAAASKGENEGLEQLPGIVEL